MAGIVRHTGENTVSQLPPRLIDVDDRVVVKLQRLGVALQAAEHGPIGHVVAVDHRHRIAEIGLVIGLFRIQRTGLGVLAVQIAVQVIPVIAGMLGDKISHLLADGAARRTGNTDAGVHVRPLLLRRREIHRHFYRLRRHEDLLVLRFFRHRCVVLVLLPAPRQYGGSQRQDRQKQRHAAQKLRFDLHCFSFPTALPCQKRRCGVSAASQDAFGMIPYAAPVCNLFFPPRLTS